MNKKVKCEWNVKRAGHLRVRSAFLGLTKLAWAARRQQQKSLARGQHPKEHMKACKGRGDLNKPENFVRKATEREWRWWNETILIGAKSETLFFSHLSRGKQPEAKPCKIKYMNLVLVQVASALQGSVHCKYLWIQFLEGYLIHINYHHQICLLSSYYDYGEQYTSIHLTSSAHSLAQVLFFPCIAERARGIVGQLSDISSRARQLLSWSFPLAGITLS